MEEDDEIQSHLSPGSGSPASPRPVGRITVTVAAAPPQQPPPPPPTTQNTLTLALPIQQTRNGGGGGSGGGGGGGGGREDCWSEGATAVLIEAWGDRYLELSRGNLKQKHWKEVADIVSGREDYTKTPKTDIQCKNRIDTVKKKYKLEKAKISAGGGPSKWPFYDRLDHLIGPTAKISGSGGGGHAVALANSSSQQKVPLGIPVGVRSASPFQGQRDQKPHLHHHQLQPVQLKNQKIQFKRRAPVDSGSSREASPASTDSFPLEVYERKRPRTGREMNLNPNLNPNPNPGRVRIGRASMGGGREGGGGREKKGWGNAVKELTQAILKFGEAYEQAESSKLQQVVEMEKQRMKFAKELELQRMQFFMKTQLEISQLKHGRRGGIGNASNHHSNNNNNNSDSST